MSDVGLIVERVREFERRHVRQFRWNDPRGWPFAAQQLPAHLGELQIGLPGNDVVRKGGYGLSLGFVADLRPAENDGETRTKPPQSAEYFQRFAHVPDVNSALQVEIGERRSNSCSTEFDRRPPISPQRSKPAIREVVTIHRGDHGVLHLQFGGRGRDAAGLVE